LVRDKVSKAPCSSRSPSDGPDLADLCEIAPHRATRLGCKLDKHPPPVMRIGSTNEKTLADHRLQPPQRGRRWNCSGNAETRDRHSQLRDFGLKEVEQHIPSGVGKQLFTKIVTPEPSRPDHRAHRLG